MSMIICGIGHGCNSMSIVVGVKEALVSVHQIATTLVICQLLIASWTPLSISCCWLKLFQPNLVLDFEHGLLHLMIDK